MNKLFNKELLIYFLFILLFLLSFSLASSSKTALTLTDDDFIIGIDSAPVTIIEYASLSCSHCAEFHINTLPELIKEYVDKGKVKIEFRDFPFNYPALLGSMVFHCVPEEVRFQYSKALYQLQSKWVNRENTKTTQELYKIMQSGGMKKEEFNNCIKNVDLENKILQGLMDAQSEFNIKSTPSFLINGLLIEGNKPFKDFKKIIDEIID